LIRIVTWAVSGVVLISGLFFIRDPNISPVPQVYAALMVEAGGAFFFALSVGLVIDRLRDAEGYSVLWLFGQQFRRAGVLAFYSDREGDAEIALRQAFEKHHRGEVLMAGASLRLFLAPGHPFCSSMKAMLTRKGGAPVEVKALSCSPENSHELPVRSFVEEFNQDQSFPNESRPFDWKKRISFDFAEFERGFYQKHGIDAPSEEKLRVIGDLESTRQGVKELQGAAKSGGNHIVHREYNSAPYCTVIIFPDKAFYTPNLLCTEVPVNMPMIVFHRSSDAYAKLENYVRFLWWISDPEAGEA
jgi:hypothetical protein